MAPLEAGAIAALLARRAFLTREAVHDVGQSEGSGRPSSWTSGEVRSFVNFFFFSTDS